MGDVFVEAESAELNPPRRGALLKCVLTVVGWHTLGVAGVYLEGHAKKNGCHQGKCGVDGDTLDGLAYFDQFEALILLGLLGLVAAVAVTARRRRHPVVIGTVASLGAFVVIASEIWVALHR